MRQISSLQSGHQEIHVHKTQPVNNEQRASVSAQIYPAESTLRANQKQLVLSIICAICASEAVPLCPWRGDGMDAQSQFAL